MIRFNRWIEVWATLPALLMVTAVATIGTTAQAAGKAREGKQVVEAVCSSCHVPGKDGAPKLGDRDAWTPRMARGLDTLVDAAIYGHGSMPSRGGMPQLEREELRSAIVYMFNYGLPPVVPPPDPVAADPRHKLIAGTDVYFGVMPASAVRDKPGAVAAKLSVPSGKDVYHLNISLADNKSGVPVRDAQVTLRVSDGMTVQEKTLAPVAANKAVSYGNFFRFSSGSAYNIHAEIRRPGVERIIVSDFDYRAR